MTDLTLIIPYYRNPMMLARQVEEWNKYPPAVKIICVDDGSPEPAHPIIRAIASPQLHPDNLIPGARLEIFRIGVDIPWNRGGARNLGAHVATTDWIMLVDIDHILPADAAVKLLEFKLDNKKWYRFPRWRVGAADETRKKDGIPADCAYGRIHPHVDSYLVRRKIYWQIGGYDEDYSGGLGGGNPFLHQLEATQPVDILPEPIRLEVYTRAAITDANDWSLSRDTSKYRALKIRKESTGDIKAKNPLRFPWKREL